MGGYLYSMQNAPMLHPDDYLSSLNPAQRLAVETTEGAVLVLAGAGTGKTRVLTTRLAHLLRTNRAWPGQILAVTFTNKAAQEMKHRVSALMGGAPVEGWWLGTFHALAARMLRRHADLVGLQSSFTILDADDQVRLIKQLMEAEGIDTKKWPAKLLADKISAWKDKGWAPNDVASGDAGDIAGGKLLQIYRQYQDRLKTLNAADFGDLLLHMIQILKNPANAEILADYHRRFKYVLVDEYQDTNVAQYLWLRLLAKGSGNICCVGDDDQSIYGWRGAEVENILRFEKDFPGATIVRLEVIYRSTGHILACATAVISLNEGRLGKELFTSEGDGEKIRVRGLWDGEAEARWAGEEIESLQHKRYNLNDMAVLVRAGFQTREFEERFIQLGLPYRVTGGPRFYERMEIRDALAYLRVVNQKDDDLALERIINTPKRGIGDKTMGQLHSYARAHNISLYAAIEQMLAKGELQGKTGATLQKLLEQFASWRERGGIHVNQPMGFAEDDMLPYEPQYEEAPDEAPPEPGDLSLAELTNVVLDESGYRAMLQADSSPEAAGRLDNLNELVGAVADYPNLATFLEHVGLVSDSAKTDDGEMVSIMSLHAAKGLEFDVVFLAGWEEGIFPSQRTLDELGTAGLEEERRLAYVGITRARHHLTISHTSNRLMYTREGPRYVPQVRSSFVEEIPAGTIEFLDGGPYMSRASGPSLFQREVESILATRVQPAADALRKGSRVFHQKFGNGVILKIEGDHLEIAFKHAGIKKILAEYVEKAD